MTAADTSASELLTSDEALAARVRDHDDRSAYGEIVARHTDRLVAYCRSRVRDAAEAEDIVQDVWIKVWTHRERFQQQGEASFRRWLFTIAGRTCIDRLRKCAPEPTSEEFLLDQGVSLTQTPEWQALLAEQVAAVGACVEQLPERQRCVVRATLEGCKTGAAADRCGCTAAQAATAKHHATRGLQECLSSKGV